MKITKTVTPADRGESAARNEKNIIRIAEQYARQGLNAKQILQKLSVELDEPSMANSYQWLEWIRNYIGVKKSEAVRKADDGKFKKGQKVYFKYTTGIGASFEQFDGDEVTIVADKGNGMFLVDFGSGVGQATLPSRNLVNPKYASMSVGKSITITKSFLVSVVKELAKMVTKPSDAPSPLKKKKTNVVKADWKEHPGSSSQLNLGDPYKKGDKVSIPGEGKGEVVSYDSTTGKIKVKLESGKTTETMGWAADKLSKSAVRKGIEGGETPPMVAKGMRFNSRENSVKDHAIGSTIDIDTFKRQPEKYMNISNRSELNDLMNEVTSWKNDSNAMSVNLSSKKEIIPYWKR